jgi:hypothetical protein
MPTAGSAGNAGSSHHRGGFMSYLIDGANAGPGRDADVAPLQGRNHYAGGCGDELQTPAM